MPIEATCEYTKDLFAGQGIAPKRIELLSHLPSYGEHLAAYNRIDIALDTFPYNGTTTTCEALWMGVPVVTLAGDRHASRVGVSILSNIGLPELIAQTEEEYIEIAVKLSEDMEKLRSLRERLRDMMRHSPVCDAKGFTANWKIAIGRCGGTTAPMTFGHNSPYWVRERLGITPPCPLLP